jgi:hypothetical protein
LFCLVLYCIIYYMFYIDDCPCGWESLHNTCYYFSETKMEWAEARPACRMRGGDLAVPRSSMVNNAIYNRLISKGIGSTWLGIFRMWDKKFCSICGTEISYTKWYVGEPNDSGHLENCVEILNVPGNHGMNSYWNDQSCTDVLHFVCELHYPRCKYIIIIEVDDKTFRPCM